jgi:hypothetical protein
MFWSLFKNHPQGAHRVFFARLLIWGLLIYVRYKIVRFVAVCHFITSVCVSGVPYWVIPYHGMFEGHVGSKPVHTVPIHVQRVSHIFSPYSKFNYSHMCRCHGRSHTFPVFACIHSHIVSIYNSQHFHLPFTHQTKHSVAVLYNFKLYIIW